MKDFTYARADNAAAAIDLVSRTPGAKYLGGGTNLVDLMREGIEQPERTVDGRERPALLSHRTRHLQRPPVCESVSTVGNALADKATYQRPPPCRIS